MATIEEQRAADEQAAAIAELKRQRNEVATRLAGIEARLAAAEDGAFMAELGRKEVAAMSTHEKARLVEKLGSEKFQELLLGRK